MTDVDPAIWDNPTLGAATNSVFLDQKEAQMIENRNAAIEGRPARIVKKEGRYPGYVPDNPNDPSVEFGELHNDGTPVVPAVAPPETGYDRQVTAAHSPSESLSESPTGTSPDPWDE